MLLGNGTGGFGAPTLYPTGAGTHEGVILDLNGDGRLDIALEGFSDAFVLFGNGSGGFGAATTISYAPAIVGDVRAGDFNGDGRPDLAITTLGPNQLHVRLNNGSGGFVETATPIALPGEADRIAVQDLNNDERPDLALSYTTFNGSQPAGQVSILIGDGAGGFIAPANLALPLQAGSESRVFALGDINGDGNRDLGSHRDTGRHRAACCSASATARAGSRARSWPRCRALSASIAGDVNGDGRQDLAVSTGNVASRLPRERHRRIRPSRRRSRRRPRCSSSSPI